MNKVMTKKNLMIIVLGILLIGSLVAAEYFFYLKPLNDELKSKQAELEMANQQLTIIENKLMNTTEETANSTMKLQKQIPVKRSVEQLMLDIEKAETISDVAINTISMGSAGTDESIQETQQTANENQNDTGNNKNQNDTAVKENQSTTILDEETQKQVVVLPSGMKKTPFTINGEANTYFELEEFLDSLQGLQRMVKLDNLSFQGLNEVTDAQQTDEKISFDVTISAFYFPKLEDLRNELPPIDTPDTANKKNPFNEFPVNSGK